MVLVVDDDADIRHFILRILKTTQIEGHGVGGGKAALTWLTTNDADLVILDLNMPDMHGIDVLKAIRSSPPLAHLPVLLHSAMDDDTVADVVHQHGANGVLLKGRYDIGQVVDAIKTYCRAA